MAEVCYPGFHLCSVTGGRCAEQALRYSPHVSKRQGVTPRVLYLASKGTFSKPSVLHWFPYGFGKLLKDLGQKFNHTNGCFQFSDGFWIPNIWNRKGPVQSFLSLSFQSVGAHYPDFISEPSFHCSFQVHFSYMCENPPLFWESHPIYTGLIDFISMCFLVICVFLIKLKRDD